jgi:methylated-DNA-[protein]-cysteine S-methyltransferase
VGYVYKTIASPVGELTLIAKGAALNAVLWEVETAGRVVRGPLVEDGDCPVLVETARQLEEYFAGTRMVFDVPLDFEGTAFQQRVWAALVEIPYGETRSYLEIARQLGDEGAVRAVGAANGKNPISILAPCHRVVGSGGKLTGFAGGLEAKAFLLAHEQRHAPFVLTA